MQSQAEIREHLGAHGIEPMLIAPAQVSSMIKADVAAADRIIATGLKAN